MEGKPTGALQLRQLFAAQFEDEIGFVGVKRDLPRRHRQGFDLEARQVPVDQLADVFDGPDLEVRG